MSSTFVLVSRPDLPRPTFEALLAQAAESGPVPAGSVLPVAESSGRLVCRIQLDTDESTLREQVEQFAAAQFARGYLAADDVCLAVVPAAITEASRLLLVMDVDSTLIRQEVIELLAAHAGREAEVAEVTEAAMRGELDFAQSLVQRVATLEGLEDRVLGEVLERIEFSPGARELVARFHAAGHLVAVVSGGFQQILDPLAAELGLDHALANTLGIVDGVLDGTVHGKIVDRSTKQEMLHSWAAAHGIPVSATIAAGDGANDLDMLNTAGLGVAYNAKPALREQAAVKLDFPALDVIADLVLER
ncbi:phosphoserine phosphatase SerB [Glutamicibacter sp. MNS18]|uniref:phosphoserine phosphatase SerB n=1 Tax=Glutamicibacter sp. MNS18 TaxID=2989817 RepID=UPI002235B93F|nr:phosphoserine phosphatase SerB [Glutamicibacter sp. MNS18]MCW4464939.1 phosphoserine phosphatase SerB [Glutamicibacter sp. MNS18]